MNFNSSTLMTEDFTQLQDIDPDDNMINSVYRSLASTDQSLYYTIEKYNQVFSQCKGIKFLHANIRSYNANILNFDGILGSLAHMPEVFCLSETWLNSNNADSTSYKGYNGHHVVRPGNGRGGGVSVFVDSSLCSTKLEEVSFCDYSIETCAVKVSLNSSNLIVIAVYKPQLSNVQNFTSKLRNILTHSTVRTEKIVILGDFNINLLNDDTENVIFTTELQSLGFLPLITKPTRFPVGNSSGDPSLIDHIWTNSYSNYSSGILLCDVTDHHPIFLHLDCTPRNNDLVEIRFRVHDEGSMDKFFSDVQGINWDELFSDNINISMVKFDEIINKLYCQNFKLKIKYVSPKRLGKPWLSSAILKSVKEKSRLFKMLKLGNLDRTIYNEYKNRLTTTIRYAKNSYYKKIFADNQKNSKKIWSVFRNLIGKNKSFRNIKEIKIGNSSIVDDLDIAKTFNDHFSSVGARLDAALPTSNSDHSQFMGPCLSQTFFLNPVTPEEISETILKLKRSKTDINTLPVSLLVSLRYSLCKPISQLVNLSFSSGTFPDPLKYANVIPIHKSGPFDDVRKYRPISILPIYSKIFEKCMATRLVSFLNKYNVISPNQFGFQKGKNTTQAILNFLTKIYESFNEKMHTVGVFLDFRNAFDTVNHGILVDKLEHYGIRGIAKSWFISYLSNRKQRVRVNSAFSPFNSVNMGVPQGSVLGPILFNLYINDLPKVSKKLNTTLFADDSTLTFSHQNYLSLISILNQELENIYKWTISNRLSINLDKTVAMIFTNRNFDPSLSPIRINNSLISQVFEHKFLGIVIDPKLKFNKHIMTISSKISKSIGIFYKTRSQLSEQLLTMLYYSLIYPYLLYANAVWGGTFPTLLEPLVLLQKRIIRLITNEEYLAHTNPLFLKTNILKISEIHTFVLAQRGYNAYPVSNPPSPIHTYSTRNRNNPRAQFQRLTICQHSLEYSLPVVWNSLPNNIKCIERFNSFKKYLKEFLISKYLP